LITILYVFLSVASLASATEGETIRGGTLTIDPDVGDGRDLGRIKKDKQPKPGLPIKRVGPTKKNPNMGKKTTKKKKGQKYD